MRILCVIGTRPEAIKMAPVIKELKARPWAQVGILSTSQHRELLDSVLDFFDLTPDFDLDVMRPNQSLSKTFAKIIVGTEEVIRAFKPDVILVQGDTTTVLAASMAAFYSGVQVGHVEAGLRTGDIHFPFPEEANRVLTSRLVNFHFAPTSTAQDNLIREGVHPSHIVETGNTVIDALFLARDRLQPIDPLASPIRRVLVTVHRRENFGRPLEEIVSAILSLAKNHPNVEFTIPVHPNPQVKTYLLGSISEQSNIKIVEPLGYADLVRLMEACEFVITDSGGLQEEAPALGKPVIILRNETERAEAVSLGAAVLVGSDKKLIVSVANRLLMDKEFYDSMVLGYSPYGDGLASQRIANFLENLR